jgi:RNA polymerase sigma factor (TIGR02999 family)
MNAVTELLTSIDQGDPRAAEQLLPLVYDELRKLAAVRLAQERPGQTLQATALVHEAYLRLVGGGTQDSGRAAEGPFHEGHPYLKTERRTPVAWHSRGHFFAAAAEAMRRILIEGARRKHSLKAGGGMTRVDLAEAVVTIDPEPENLLALDEALTRLAGDDPTSAELAKLRLFAGLSVEEAADALGISRTTGFRNWTYARAFLQAELAK